MNLNDVDNCVSGGPLEAACELLLRQLGTFSGHLYDIVSRAASNNVDEIRFWGDHIDNDLLVVWRYGRQGQGKLPPKVSNHAMVP